MKCDHILLVISLTMNINRMYSQSNNANTNANISTTELIPIKSTSSTSKFVFIPSKGIDPSFSMSIDNLHGKT